MGLFSKLKGSSDAELAPQGGGSGTVILTFAGGKALEIPVVGLHHGEAIALAGKRPRDDSWREKTLKVRLVREPMNPHDANAIAVSQTPSGILVTCQGTQPPSWHPRSTTR